MSWLKVPLRHLSKPLETLCLIYLLGGGDESILCGLHLFISAIFFHQTISSPMLKVTNYWYVIDVMNRCLTVVYTNDYKALCSLMTACWLTNEGTLFYFFHNVNMRLSMTLVWCKHVIINNFCLAQAQDFCLSLFWWYDASDVYRNSHPSEAHCSF